jgi:hypothetical protein
MFSNEGGRLMLYRPGQAPIEAPKVPKVYQILKGTSNNGVVDRCMRVIGLT